MAFILLWLDVTLCDRCEKTCIVSGKWNEDAESVQDFIFWFCVWFKSRELGGRVSPRFPCVNPVMGSFTLDLLRATVSYWTKLKQIEFCQTSMMKLFCENSQQLKDVNYFCKKLHHQTPDWIPNPPPIGKAL